MAKKLKPANISLLSPKPAGLKNIRQVRSLNTFEGATESFDPNGLYSVETFGRVGEKTRMITFGYTDCKLDILHPHVWRELLKVKELYGGILAGTTYAKYEPKLRDFVEADMETGKTGYSFFMSYWAELKLPVTNSTSRKSVVKMIDNNRENAKVRYVLVLPAGLRELDTEGERPKEDVINTLYRRLLAVSQTVNENVKPTDPINDPIRYQLQKIFNEIYQELYQRMDDKNGYIQSKFMTRGVANATANVITAMDCAAGDLFGPNNPDPRSFVLGTFQFTHAALPLFFFNIKEQFLMGKCWGVRTATLIGKKSLKPVQVDLTDKNIEFYGTHEGLQRLANRFENIKFRSQPATVQGGYLKLICWVSKTEFYLLDSIDEVKEPEHRELTTPLTWGELFYITNFLSAKEIPVESTRYPAAEEGSAVMSFTHLKSTQPSMIVTRYLNDGTTILYNEYPIEGADWLESSQPHPCRHKAYKADHDGDMLTSLCSVAEETIQENKDYYNSWDSLIGSNGELVVTFDLDITEWVIIGATAKNVGV